MNYDEYMQLIEKSLPEDWLHSGEVTFTEERTFTLKTDLDIRIKEGHREDSQFDEPWALNAHKVIYETWSSSYFAEFFRIALARASSFAASPSRFVSRSRAA